jgi:hypothetical protein
MSLHECHVLYSQFQSTTALLQDNTFMLYSDNPGLISADVMKLRFSAEPDSAKNVEHDVRADNYQDTFTKIFDIL